MTFETEVEKNRIVEIANKLGVDHKFTEINKVYLMKDNDKIFILSLDKDKLTVQPLFNRAVDGEYLWNINSEQTWPSEIKMSFSKSIDKIVKDIKKRVFDEYIGLIPDMKQNLKEYDDMRNMIVLRSKKNTKLAHNVKSCLVSGVITYKKPVIFQVSTDQEKFEKIIKFMETL